MITPFTGIFGNSQNINYYFKKFLKKKKKKLIKMPKFSLKFQLANSHITFRTFEDVIYLNISNFRFHTSNFHVSPDF